MILLQENLYELLELTEIGIEATNGQISTAYRKKALVYHPDKLGREVTENDKGMWNKI